MAVYQVFKPGSPWLQVHLDANAIEVPEDRLSKVLRAFSCFQQHLDAIYSQIRLATDSLLHSNPHSIDLIEPLQRAYRPMMNQEMMKVVYKIIFALKAHHGIQGASCRWKIQDLCSVTIFNHPFEDIFAIHLKKKRLRALLGEGFNSKVFATYLFSINHFELCAEKTIYTDALASLKKEDLPVTARDLFCNDPKACYEYNALCKPCGNGQLITKRAQILDFYEMALCELIDLDAEHHMLHPRKIIDIAKLVAIAIKNLHDHKIVHRDVKPDNFLVKFNTAHQSFDWNDFRVVATDFETFIAEDIQDPLWYGTSEYHPPTKDTERQARPADVYALGVFFSSLFRRLMPDPGLQAFIDYMKDLDVQERFTIDEVVLFLDELF